MQPMNIQNKVWVKLQTTCCLLMAAAPKVHIADIKQPNRSLCLVCVHGFSEGLYLKRTVLLSRQKTRTSYTYALCRRFAFSGLLWFSPNYFLKIQLSKCCAAGSQKTTVLPVQL